MKAKKQELVHTLLDVLAPQLRSVVPPGEKMPKALLKSIGHVAEHLVRLRAKQEKRAAQAAAPTAKQQRKQLTEELVAVLDAHFAEDVLAEQETLLLTETAEELATKLTKLRTKQRRQEKEPTGPASEAARAEEGAAPGPEKRTRRRTKALPSVE